MANMRAKRSEAINRVENGPKSGPALGRIRAVLPTITAAAQQFKQRAFAVTGGLRIDPMTRVEQRVGPNPNLSPEGAQAELTKARDDFQATVNTALATASDDLNTVVAVHERVPPLGTQLLLPPNRGAELQALATLLTSGTYAQWHAVAQAAVDANDRPKAEVLAFVARAQASAWHADRAHLDADVAALEDAFSTPATLAGDYAAGVAATMRQALQGVAATLERPDGVDQLLAGEATRANPVLRPLPDELDVDNHWAAVARAAAEPASASGAWVLVGDTPGTVHLVPGRSSEAPGPVRTAADSGPSQI